MCPRSSDPFYIVTYYIKWDTTFWTHSNLACFTLQDSKYSMQKIVALHLDSSTWGCLLDWPVVPTKEYKYSMQISYSAPCRKFQYIGLRLQYHSVVLKANILVPPVEGTLGCNCNFIQLYSRPTFWCPLWKVSVHWAAIAIVPCCT